MKYKEAIKKSMGILAKDKKTIFIGYNLLYGSKAYGTLISVPKNQILEMPVAENLMSGIAIGMALKGFKPVLIFERHDFMLNALDSIINHLDKIWQISNNEFNPKVIIRAIVGATKPFYPGIQHSQDFTDLFRNSLSFPVIELYNSKQVLYCYRHIYKYNDSIMFIEYREKYNE